MDKGNGASKEIVNSLQFVSQHMTELSSVFVEGAKVAMAYKAVGIATTLYDKAQAAQIAATAMRAEATAVAQNTGSIAANASAARAAATAQIELGRATSATGGQMAGLKAGILGVVSKLGALGAAASVAYVGWDLLKGGIDKASNALSDYMFKNSDAGKQAEAMALKSKVAADQAALQAAEKQKQADLFKKTSEEMAYHAAKSSETIIGSFDEVIKKGGTVKEALEGVADSLKFDTPVHASNALVALEDLKNQGKITGDEMRTQLQKSLEGVDLTVMKTNMKVGFDEMVDKANKTAKEIANLQNKINDPQSSLEQVKVYKEQMEQKKTLLKDFQNKQALSAQAMADVDNTISRESIKRTGLEYENLQGKVSNASNKAINDTMALVGSLDKLKADGVNTGDALANSFENAIKTADSPQALNVIQNKVMQLKGELGEKYTQGLLVDIKDRMLEVSDAADKAKPGINSTAEAFHNMGLKTQEQMQITAQKAQANFEVIQNSGKATAAQLTQVWQDTAKAEFEANGGVLTSTMRNEAAQRGLGVAVSETGELIIKTAAEVKAAEEKEAQEAEERKKARIEQAHAQVEAIKKAADDEAEASKQAAEATKHSMDGIAGALAGAYDKLTATISSGLQEVGVSSEQVHEIFMKRIHDVNGMGSVAAGDEFMRLFDNLNRLQAQTEKNIAAFHAVRESAISMTATLGNADVTVNDLAEAQNVLYQATNANVQGIARMDKATLRNLQNAIDSTKQKMQSLSQTALQTEQDIEASLASARGDDTTAMKLEQTRKLADLQDKLTQAEKRSNVEEIEHYKRAIDLQNQLNATQLAQAQQQAQEKAQQAQAQAQPITPTVTPPVIPVTPTPTTTPTQATSYPTSSGSDGNVIASAKLIASEIANIKKEAIDEFMQVLRDEMKRQAK